MSEQPQNGADEPAEEAATEATGDTNVVAEQAVVNQAPDGGGNDGDVEASDK